MRKLPFIVLLLAVALCLAAPGWVWHRGRVAQRAQQAELNRLAEQLRALTTEHDRLTSGMASTTPRLTDEQLKELMRLRSEVSALRRQTNALQRLRDLDAARQTDAQPHAESAADQASQAREERLGAELRQALEDISRELGPALRRYAADHSNEAPTQLSQLRRYLSATPSGQVKGLYSIEFVSEGGLKVSAEDAFVLREASSRQKPNGTYVRWYARADGTLVEASSTDGEFEEWEKAHLGSGPATGR